MREITGNDGQVIFGDLLTQDILNLPANVRIEDIPDNFLVNSTAQGKTYKGNLQVNAIINGTNLQNNEDIYFHICYPSHVKMSDDQYTAWTQRFLNHSQDERIIFVPNEQEGE